MRRLLLFCAAFSGAVLGAQTLLPAGLLLPLGLVSAVCGVACAAPGILRRLRRGDTSLRESGAARRGDGLPSEEGGMGRRIRVASLLAAGLGLGLLWCAGYRAVAVAPLEAMDRHVIPVEGLVLEYPKPSQYGGSVLIRADLPNRKGATVRLYGNADLLTAQPGERLSCYALLRRADRVDGREVNSFNARGVFLLGFVRGSVRLLEGGGFSLAGLSALWSRQVQELLRTLFPAATRVLAVPILTGNLDDLTPALSDSLRRTGLTHAVAVSGMHVSVLAGLILLLTGKNRRLAALFSIPAVLIFPLVVGFAPSVMRAVVMCAVVSLAPLFGRETDHATSLTFALFLLLIHNPYAALDPGLQLSFSATAGILLLGSPLEAVLTARLPSFGGGMRGKLLSVPARFLTSTVAVTLSALLFAAPLSAYYFKSFSLVAPLAAVLILWSVTVVFYIGLAAGVCGLFLPALGQGVALLLSPVIHYQLWMISALAGLPFAAVTMHNVYYIGWLVTVCLIVTATFLWRGWNRPLIPLVCCGITLLAAVWMTRFERQAGQLTISVLDVGQGQSVVLASDGYTALVDCGGGTFPRAGETAADYLSDMGEGTIDLLILTHYHADHANGVATLMERLTISHLLLPDVTPEDALRQEILALAADEGAQVHYVTEAAALPLGRAVLTVYPPLGSGGANEEGLTVLAAAGDFEALITGDMNDVVEAILIEQFQLPDIELLVAGHHGSKYSTSDTLLKAVTPEYAFISAGRGNSYGHPAPEALERLANAQVELYRTDLMGHLTLTIR